MVQRLTHIFRMNKECLLHNILSKSLFAIKYIGIVAFALYLFDNVSTNAKANELPDKQENKTALSSTDCKKCHFNVVVLVQTNGSAHRDKVTCVDCHEGHPPRKRDIIPNCNKCHKDTPHFDLANCLRCHQTPHTPLNITLTKSMTTPCLTCHTTQIEELRTYPSIHTTLACTACHTSHGFLPKCFACHGPHLEIMTNQDCHNCHHPHMPLIVTYGQDTPSEFCGSCHNEVYTLIGLSRAKHRNVACAQCHEAKHKMIPKCQKCHDLPHTPFIHDKFPQCRTCHGIAHNLKLNKNDMFLENN